MVTLRRRTRVFVAVGVMDTAKIFINGVHGGTREMLIPAITNALDPTWDAVQPMLCDLDGAVVEEGLLVTISGSSKQTRAMKFSFDWICVQENVKLTMPLPPPYLLQGFHHPGRSCSHVRQVAPRANVDTRVHVRVHQARVRVQPIWCRATGNAEKCVAKPGRPWQPPLSPQLPSCAPKVAAENEAAVAEPVVVLERERF